MRRALSLRARMAVFFGAAVGVALVLFSAAVVLVLVIDEPGSEKESILDLDVREDLLRVLLAMGIAAPLAVGGAAALGLLLARRALAPLAEASNRARAARSSALDLTLPVGDRGDEWDALATTLNALLAEARGSLERVRRFTADAAHEIRTPLTAIIGEAEVALRRERPPEELRAALATIRDEGQRLSSLTTSLLTLARADGGTLLVSSAPVPLGEVVRGAVERARTRLPDPARQAVVLDESGGAIVRGDRELLGRAVENLIDNAARHGGSAITVTLSCADGRARVDVDDDGPGVPPAFVPLLFDRFSRADPARSGGGFGLGLAITRSVVEAHGGTVRFVPRERGTRFTIDLASTEGS